MNFFNIIFLILSYSMTQQTAFIYGVASGDATSDSIIIWTKIDPSVKADKYKVNYYISEHIFFDKDVISGTVETDDSMGNTIKADISGLKPATLYYYQFSHDNIRSVIGKFKTARSDDDISAIKFVCLSCCHIQDGYFSAYQHVGDIKDLDFVIHLGDSIYEYGQNNKDSWNKLPPNIRKPNDKYFRTIHQPVGDCVTLEDYRTRYSQYQKDPQLQYGMSQHCYYHIWDDHEIADNTYNGGSYQHNPAIHREWKDRFAAAKQAWLENHPIRGTEIYRAVAYSKLANIILLDARSYRDKQPTRSVLSNPRTLLGDSQKKFVKENINNSKSIWTLIGNPVMFSPWNIKVPVPKNFLFNWFRKILGLDGKNNMIANPDQWDGYGLERNEIMECIVNTNNTVFLTGDLHMSMACEVPLSCSKYTELTIATESTELTMAKQEYTKSTIATELVTPSVTSDNFNDILLLREGNIFSRLLEKIFLKSNSHIKLIDVDRHGYILVNLSHELLRAEYWFLENPKDISSNQYLGYGVKILNSINKIIRINYQLKIDK